MIPGEGKDIRYYIEGQTAEVEIPVFGFPSPTVKWYRSNCELNPDDENSPHKTYRDRLGTHHLEILNATEKDEGAYKIVATNEYGTAEHEFYLQQADPPVFSEPLKDVTATNHEEITLTCKVDGIPYPEIRFYKDWHLMTESHRIKIKHVEPDTWIVTITGKIFYLKKKFK